MVTKSAQFDCGETLNIASAGDILQRLTSVMNESSAIELVADKVTKVDTAGFQVIIAAQKELERIGGNLQWKEPSEATLQGAKTLGLVEVLGLSTHIS